jgi:fatty acid synthase subunit alpha, fungi type
MCAMQKHRAGKPVIEIVSAFLYRGCFTDYENTFETTEERDYLADLQDHAAVGIFRVQSQVTFKDKTSYRNVSVSGDVFVRNQLKWFVKVGSVDFQQDNCQGNPRLDRLLLVVREANPHLIVSGARYKVAYRRCTQQYLAD